jgi:hypothetical protein
MKLHKPAFLFLGLLATSSTLAAHDDHEAEPAAAIADIGTCAKAQAAIDRLLAGLPIQMQAILGTEDPDGRRRLLRDHLLSMKEVLNHMARSSEPGAEEPARKSKHAEAAGKSPPGTEMMGGKMGDGERMRMHRAVEERLDRLQVLIQQLIENELAQDGMGEP